MLPMERDTLALRMATENFWADGKTSPLQERVSPDARADDVCRLEATWKNRLHTRSPHGPNVYQIAGL
jgi:hypothetical protein